MAWGGGTITGGAPMGGSVGGSPGNPGNGLPFAGIPWEMRQGVEKLLADEPDLAGDARWEASEKSFTHRMPEAGISLRRMLRPHRRMLALSTLFIVVEALCVQAGPFLSQKGIDDGITPHDWTALAIIGTLAILAVVVSAIASGLRVSTTGRVASRVMFELRVRTFAHLQRLSLDYYTDEKAGVIMTRMTSDIESLQQLLQDGLPQFALQGLTMVIVTVVLFFYNVELTLITLLMIVPLLTGLSLWFRSSSDKGYERVRDGIANVLSDLSESLSGVRVVTGFNRASATTCCSTATSSGEYRDANDHTAHLAAIYGPCTEFVGLLGQAALLLIGGNMVRDGTLTIGELTAFILYVNSFFLPIQSLVQQYNLYQQGQAAITKLDQLLATHPSVEEAPDAAAAAADRRRRSPSTTSPSPTTRRSPCCATSTCTSPRARPWPWSGRPVRASRPSPSSSPASTTRPSGAVADRRPRPARRHHRLAAPPARRGPPGAVPLRRHHA